MDLNFKILKKIKFGKIKMDTIEKIEELKIDPEKLKKSIIKKRTEPYEHTNYSTVKEFFYKACEMYPEEDCILEKPDKKEPYKIFTFKDFYEDVNALGTALIKILNQQNKRVIIIGETQYSWYLSYMAMLCGVGIAVPVDRELPENELENVIKRSRATAIIYSSRKAEDIKKIKENIP